jgi:proteasome lid subunit RPN8/RPN11
MTAKKVSMDLEIYKTIIAHATRYANARIPPDDWVEIAGLFYGYADGDTAVITAAVPYTHVKKVGRILKFEFSEEDYVIASGIEEEFYTRDPPQYCMGWYHSHPGIKVMFTQDDIRNQLGWQSQNPLAVGLVFNHVRLLKQYEMPARKGDPVVDLQNDPGFLVFQLDDPAKGLGANFVEVPFELRDVPINASLIANAQEFALYVQKAFNRDDEYFVEADKFIAATIAKLEEVFVGTESYLATLRSQGNHDRIPSVLQTQLAEAQKTLDRGHEMVNGYKMMLPYLEYKERERLTSKMVELFKKWDDFADSYLARFQALGAV